MNANTSRHSSIRLCPNLAPTKAFAVVTLSVTFQAGVLCADVLDDFEGGIAGWVASQPNEIDWVSSGGNQGGFLRSTDMASGLSWVSAPAEFLGDLSHLDGTGWIAFDHKTFSGASETNMRRYQVAISGPGGSAVWEGNFATTAPEWRQVRAPLVESVWAVTDSWPNLLANVTSLRIRTEVVGVESDVSGLDNVCLVNSGAAAVVAFDFDDDTQEWMSTSSEATWKANEGNPLGYWRFKDSNSQAHRLVSPPMLFTDWSDLDGSAWIQFDHTVIDTGPVADGTPYRLELLGGDDSEARWESGFVDSKTPWRTVRAPLDESAWTMESGTWTDLLAHVTSLHVKCEMIQNSGPPSDICGVDNIGIFRVPSLEGDVSAVSAGNGGIQELRLDAGLSRAGRVYLVLGSTSGTVPGLPVGPMVNLPLNFDGYLLYTLQYPNLDGLTGTLGVLNAKGVGTASIAFASGVTLPFVGQTFQHAFITFNTATLPGTPFIDFASNPASIDIQP